MPSWLPDWTRSLTCIGTLRCENQTHDSTSVVRNLDGQTWFLPMQKKGQPRPSCFAKSELQATLQPCLPLILL
ncbi:hypothetical protein RB1787 [Rhodopirellula baltica SH 1]|uniref:Uncharacterized protein n=1 Tax=Rhodopirellula baltica (strain DSM 10527 / NCIMB 13988 / SH1) TaxID=243090 RepID=Q7UWU3_RHOBA|nr:hypothetical protein RB1787 [Rhodopirellula baltica SH 1]